MQRFPVLSGWLKREALSVTLKNTGKSPLSNIFKESYWMCRNKRHGRSAEADLNFRQTKLRVLEDPLANKDSDAYLIIP